MCVQRGVGGYRAGRRWVDAMAWMVCQYTGVSSWLDLLGTEVGRLLAGNPLSASVRRWHRWGRLSCWLGGAVGVAGTSYCLGS